MKRVFQVYNSICTKYSDPEELIEKLLSYFSNRPKIDNNIDDFLYKNLKKEIDQNPIFLYQLIGLVHQKRKEKNKIANTDERKHYGIYYTDYEIATVLVRETLSLVKDKSELLKKSFYEPCVGSGIFIISYIDYILEQIEGLTSAQIQKIIDNIYFSDVDADAIKLLKRLLPAYIESKHGVIVTVPESNYYTGNILFTSNNGNFEKNGPKLVFGKEKFDIVITNPPYKLLKENSNKYGKGNAADDTDIKRLVEFIKNNNIYKYNNGTLNYYRLFIEEIIENYSHNDSFVGLLIPNTLLNDLQSETLRKRIIENFQLTKLFIVPEKNDFFPDITQSFCFFGINKGGAGREIYINPSVVSKDDFSNSCVNLKLDKIRELSPAMPIIQEGKIGWSILKKISLAPTIKSYPDLLNLRGELDLTLNKDYITDTKTKYPLIKGANIKEFEFSCPEIYVSEDFVEKLNGKKSHIASERIACQQISNIHGRKRLKFTVINENYILANSCNYLCKTASLFGDKNLSLKYTLGVLNSYLLDWRFKITNSNNHISNYELGQLPLPKPNEKNKILIEKLVENVISGHNSSKSALNLAVFKLFNLDKTEMKYIAEQYNDDRLKELINEEVKGVI